MTDSCAGQKCKEGPLSTTKVQSFISPRRWVCHVRDPTMHRLNDKSPSAYRVLAQGLSQDPSSTKSSGLPSESHLRRQTDVEPSTDGSSNHALIVSLRRAAVERDSAGLPKKVFVSLSLDDISANASHLQIRPHTNTNTLGCGIGARSQGQRTTMHAVLTFATWTAP
jgi:hypothetical protein